MKNIVCVAADHCYDDSMGAYVIAYLWDGEKVTREGGIYQDTDYTSANATIEEKRAASVWLESNTEESASYNKYAKCDTYIDCIITLKRSRKAPNNTPVKVVDFIDGGYNSRFNNYESEKVVVETEQGERFTVSYGCIDTLVKGVQKFPYWYVSENEYKQAIEQQQIANNELKAKADKKERAELVASFVSQLVELDKKGFDVDSNELLAMLNGFSVVDIVTNKEVTNEDIKAVLLNIFTVLKDQTEEQAFQVVDNIKKDFNNLVSLFDKGLNQRQVQYFELLSIIDTVKACYEVKQVVCNGYGQLKQFKLVDGSTVGAWGAYIKANKMLRGGIQ